MINLADLYSDYLLVNQGQATATGLSALLDKQISHDQITRHLSKNEYNSKDLWRKVKPFAKKITSPQGVLIVDDTIEEKRYMQESDLICYHYDHCQQRTLKGINQLTALYHSEKGVVPVGYSLIEKPLKQIDPKTGKCKRFSLVSKHDLFASLVKQAIENQLSFKYILADSWFSSAENIKLVASLQSSFIFPLKSNRRVYLSESEKALGRHQPIESLSLEENQSQLVWLKEVDFPLIVTKQIFKDGDQIKGVLYLVSNDLTADGVSLQTNYARRWQIEQFHKSIKSNAGYAHSPAHTVRTQSNHLFLCMLAFVKLEQLSRAKQTNHFYLKKILTLNALKSAWQRLQQMKASHLLMEAA